MVTNHFISFLEFATTLGQNASFFWTGAADPTSTSTLFQWSDGTMFQRPPGLSFSLPKDCLVLDLAQNKFEAVFCGSGVGENAYPFCVKGSSKFCFKV